MVGEGTGSHHYGYATCENIGPCPLATQAPGSKCMGKHGSVGFCWPQPKASIAEPNPHYQCCRHGKAAVVDVGDGRTIKR